MTATASAAMVVAEATVEGTLRRNGGDGSDWYRLDGVSAGGERSERALDRATPDRMVAKRASAGRRWCRTSSCSLVVDAVELLCHPPRDGVEDDGRFVRVLSAEVEAARRGARRIDDADEPAVEYALEVDLRPHKMITPTEMRAPPTPSIKARRPLSSKTREDTDTLHITPERARRDRCLVSVSLNEVAEATGAISLRVGSVGGNDHRRYFGRARHEVLEGTTYSIRLNHARPALGEWDRVCALAQ